MLSSNISVRPHTKIGCPHVTSLFRRGTHLNIKKHFIFQISDISVRPRTEIGCPLSRSC